MFVESGMAMYWTPRVEYHVHATHVYLQRVIVVHVVSVFLLVVVGWKTFSDVAFGAEKCYCTLSALSSANSEFFLVTNLNIVLAALLSWSASYYLDHCRYRLIMKLQAYYTIVSFLCMFVNQEGAESSLSHAILITTLIVLGAILWILKRFYSHGDKHRMTWRAQRICLWTYHEYSGPEPICNWGERLHVAVTFGSLVSFVICYGWFMVSGWECRDHPTLGKICFFSELLLLLGVYLQSCVAPDYALSNFRESYEGFSHFRKGYGKDYDDELSVHCCDHCFKHVSMSDKRHSD